MNKILRFSFLSLLMLVCGLVNAQTTVTFAAGTDFGANTAAGADEITKDGVTMAISNGMLYRDDHYRLYKSATLTISSTIGAITKVEITSTASGTEQYGPGNVTVEDGTYSYEENIGTWTGSSNSVVLTASEAQVRFTQLVVTVDPSVPVVDISNTPETAYTVAEAKALIDAGEDLETEVYVKGTITSISQVSTNSGNATYVISDDATSTESQLTVYRGYYYNGKKFTSEDQIKVGDEVVVYGALTLYNETYEIASGSSIYSINGEIYVPADISNTPETAYTVAEALALIDADESLETQVYVKGIITSITEISTSYGNATYLIGDVAGQTENLLTVYRGKYINGDTFTSEDQLNVGDEVIVYGTLTLYYSTYEFTTGSSIYSHNGMTTGINTIETTDASAKAIYNLAGQRLSTPQKGINIIGGKKVVIK